MIVEPVCPVCGSSSAKELGTQEFERDAQGLSSYVMRRYKVLFELWAPGVSSLRVKFLCCERCGMVWFGPRPTPAEVDAKYQFLGGASSSTAHNPVVTPIDEERSKELRTRLAPWIGPDNSVLDFGGGTGSLMAEFVRTGHSCALIDYSSEAIPGVVRCGTTLEDAPAKQRFDVVVASHVLEHLPEPFDTVLALADRLSDCGVLYAEVPLEILGGPPRLREPVTHLNFFSDSSLSALLRRAGLEVLSCEVTTSIHANGSAALAVCAVARPGGARGSLPVGAESVETTRGWLEFRGWRRLLWLGTRHPRVWTRLWRPAIARLTRRGNPIGSGNR